MYTATIEEVVHDVTVITDTLLIHSAPIIALFDSSSTHTLKVKTFIDRIGVSVEDLGYNLVVLTLAGVVYTTSECVRGIVLVIQQRIFLTNFIVLLIWEFDTIFGMGWMTDH